MPPLAKYALGATVTLLVSFGAEAARADTLFGVYAGAGAWQQKLGGDVQAGASVVDLEQDLGIDDETNNMLYAAVEHGLPVLPNVRLYYTDVTASGSETLSRTIEFNGAQFTLGEDVAARLDLTHADMVFYYELLDTWASLDVGVTARWLDGQIAVATAQETSRAKFTGVVPLLYGRVRADLPLSGFWLGAEVQGIAYSDNDMLDANAQLGWESALGLGFELGWRTLRVKLDAFEDIDAADVDISGPYAALNFHF
ncbi:MAG: TIGR04219 family outer membrane beta-barrel protein [Pseudomonadales bacterium]